MDKYQFLNRLEKRGYHNLGQGSYSSVWAKPGSSKVIKVGVASDSWLIYVVWAMSKGYVGNHSPRVDSFKMNSEYFVAVMEKLHRLGSKNNDLMYKMTDTCSFIIKNTPAEWKTFGRDFK